jgi:hypothetical protein
MGWRARGRSGGRRGLWPGHGPFSDLPPWQRPGWLYGRGACWWLYPNYYPAGRQDPDQASVPPIAPAMPIIPQVTKEQETQMLEQHMTILQAQLDAVKNRLTELATE